MVAVTIQSKLKTTQEVSQSSYFKLFLYHPCTDTRCRMKSICSVATGVGLSLPGVTITSPTGMQRLGRATTAVTGSVGLPG